MKARAAILSLISIRPHTIQEVGRKLPFSIRTVYRYVEELIDDGIIVKRGRGKGTVLEISDGYIPQKLKEIYIQSLTHGLDPEVLMRESTQKILEALKEPKMVSSIQEETSLSRRWILVILKDLERGGLINYRKRKPIEAELNDEHPLNKSLEEFYGPNEKEDDVYISGTRPFEEIFGTPTELERTLFNRIDQDLVIKDTGFMIRGEGGRLTILESIEEGEGLEGVFLRKLMTTEGAEDLCIDIIHQKRLDYNRVLELARKKGIVNIVGCYLDIINDIKEIVPLEVIRNFQEEVSDKRMVFLPHEREYGKSGWEETFEERWNVDLYLDLSSVKHGVSKW